MNFQELRLDFIMRRKGSMALPITGIIVYSAAAILSLIVDPRWHNLVLTLCFWSIMPVGAVMMKLRGEEIGSPQENPLFGLAAKARIPVTVGIGFALHWVVFSWTLDHPVGFIHLGLRILFVITAWHLVPGDRMGAVAAGVALAYAISVFQLSRIDWQTRLATVS